MGIGKDNGYSNNSNGLNMNNLIDVNIPSTSAKAETKVDAKKKDAELLQGIFGDMGLGFTTAETSGVKTNNQVNSDCNSNEGENKNVISNKNSPPIILNKSNSSNSSKNKLRYQNMDEEVSKSSQQPTITQNTTTVWTIIIIII